MPGTGSIRSIYRGERCHLGGMPTKKYGDLNERSMRIRRADPASSAPHDNCEGIPKETSTPCAPLPTAPLLVLQLLRLALGHLEDSLFQPKAVTNLQLLSFWQPAAGLCIFLYLPPLQAQLVFLYQLATNPLLHWDLLLKNSIVPSSDTIGYIACKKLLLWL